jgi:hypothetical protein
MKKALVTAAGAHMAGVLACSEPTFRHYAQTFGYDLFIHRDVQDGEKYDSHESHMSRWAKLDYIKSALKTHDLVVWMDADVMIIKFDRDIAGDMPVDAFQALALEVFPHRFNPQTGVWILRKDQMTDAFLAQVEANSSLSEIREHAWADQAGVSVALGWEILDKRKSFDGRSHARPMNFSPFLKRTGWLSPEWNPQGLTKHITSNRTVHFAGEHNYVRQPKMELILRGLRDEGVIK